MNEKKNKHMTDEDRQEIQDCLYKKMSFKAIGKLIGKDPTTISKEIKLHAQTHINGFVTTDEFCPKLLKAPFVCNGCNLKSSSSCHYARRLYLAKTSQKEYENTLVESRKGIALNKMEFYENDRIITERINKGQHIHQILHSSDVTVSKSTVYRYFHSGYLSVSPIDLPRAMKFKPRSKKKQEYVPKGLKIGRSYQDFLLLKEESIAVNYQQLDTVIGRIGGKVIMTIHFPNINFMFGLLLEDKTAAQASEKILELKKELLKHNFNFSDIFPVLLTDNGGEFSDVYSFENNLDGEKETSLYFCDPMSSHQKPHIEKNHTLFRDIVPKGSSFDHFTQDTVNLIFSHVNCVYRESLNNKTPYELFCFLYSEKLASIFGVKKIETDTVIQSTKLQNTKDFIKTLSK